MGVRYVSAGGRVTGCTRPVGAAASEPGAQCLPVRTMYPVPQGPRDRSLARNGESEPCIPSGRDGMTVAWHEVPGKGFRPIRPGGYGVILGLPHVFGSSRSRWMLFKRTIQLDGCKVNNIQYTCCHIFVLG